MFLARGMKTPSKQMEKLERWFYTFDILTETV